MSEIIVNSINKIIFSTMLASFCIWFVLAMLRYSLDFIDDICMLVDSLKAKYKHWKENKKNELKQNRKELIISERLYNEFCQIISHLIEYIKDEPMQEEYRQHFNQLRRMFWMSNKYICVKKSEDK